MDIPLRAKPLESITEELEQQNNQFMLSLMNLTSKPVEVEVIDCAGIMENTSLEDDQEPYQEQNQN